MELTGGSIRGEKIFNSRKMLDEVFGDDASFTPGIYFWELNKQTYDEDTPIGVRFYHRTSSSANGVTVKFQTLNDTRIVVGDLIVDTVNNEYWICTEAFNIDTINYQGKFTLCNWMLKWQNAQGDILEYPCYNANTTQYNTGETPNRQFTVGSSQHSVLLPCDENTVILDTPQRFFLDKNYLHPTTYIITQNDTTSLNFGTKGIIRLTLAEYEFNTAKDRIDLGVCDYFEYNAGNNEDSESTFNLKTIIYYDTLIIKSGGSSQTYIAKTVDDNGNEVTGSHISWNIVCDFVDKLKVEENHNQINIAIDDDDYVDEDFKLICHDEDNNCTSEIIITIDSLL